MSGVPALTGSAQPCERSDRKIDLAEAQRLEIQVDGYRWKRPPCDPAFDKHPLVRPAGSMDAQKDAASLGHGGELGAEAAAFTGGARVR